MQQKLDREIQEKKQIQDKLQKEMKDKMEALDA